MKKAHEPFSTEVLASAVAALERRTSTEPLQWDVVLEQAAHDARAAVTETPDQLRMVADSIIKKCGGVATPSAVASLTAALRESWGALNSAIEQEYQNLFNALPQPKLVGNNTESIRKHTEDWVVARVEYLAKDGVLLLDKAGAEILREVGESGALSAEQILKRSREKSARTVIARRNGSHTELATCKKEQYALWFDAKYSPPVLFARILAEALWRDRVAVEFQRSDTASLCDPVLTNLVGASKRGAQISFIEGTAALRDYKDKRIGSIGHGPEIAQRFVSIKTLSSLTAQRFIRALLWKAHEQHWYQGKPNSHIIEIDGGYDALCDFIGVEARGNKVKEELKSTLHTLAALHIDSPKGEGGVFAWYHTRACPGQKARYELHLIGPLRPDYVARELAGHRKPENKRLVPVPIPQHMPPFVSRSNEWPAQACYQLLMLRELRMKAREYAEEGAVYIPESRRNLLAKEAGVTKRIVPTIFEAYATGVDDYPAFLIPESDERYSLANSYAAEHRAIVAAGEAEAKGRRGGKRSAAQRRGESRRPPRSKRAGAAKP